jgi:hypothetical protein
MAFKTIILKGEGIPGEAIGSGTIRPGDLIEKTSAGLVQRHSSAGGYAQLMVAVENSIAGVAIGTAYASTALVQYVLLHEGMTVLMRLADGENVAINDKLESNGSLGELRKEVADTSAGTIKPGARIGRAAVAVDMSSSAGADPSGLIQVEISRG